MGRQKPSEAECDKTKLMLLGRKKREEELNGMRVTMGEQEIQRSRSVKRLGVVLDDYLTWREQICRTSEDQEMESSATYEDQEGAVQHTSATLFGLLFYSVAGVF